jgi:hypothetical protein
VTFPWTADVCFWPDGQIRKTFDGRSDHVSSRSPFQISVQIYWGRHIHFTFLDCFHGISKRGRGGGNHDDRHGEQVWFYYSE